MAAADAGSLSQHVYTGFWVNKAYESPYGATLTLSRQSGGFLIAFLAIYVGFVSKSVWTITRFGLHFSFSSRLRPDGMYHQRQVLLKNARTAPEALKDAFDLSWAWKKQNKAKLGRLIPVVMGAAAVASTFTVASIFSSRVTANDSNEVLLLGKGCDTNKSIDGIEDLRTDMRDLQMRIVDYLAQAQACYRNGHLNQPQQCQIHVRNALPYTMNGNVACPFPDKICRSPSGNVRLESGPIDSLTDLGINQAPRFTVKLNRQCAPLVTEGYTTWYTERQDNASFTYLRYNYGNTVLLQNDTVSDYIYQARVRNPREAVSSRSFFENGFSDYRLRLMETSLNGPTAFSPIPELNRTDAAVMLIFLDQSNILYMNQTEDPWFHATTPVDVPFMRGDGFSFYRADEPATVLGCASQFLLCAPESPSDCVNLSLDQRTSMKHLTTLWPHTEDWEAILGFRIAITKIFQGPEMFYTYPGVPSLFSRFTISNSIQSDMIPPNRWQLELEYTFQAWLASLQSALVEASTKGSYEMSAERQICPDREACRKLCYNQRIRTGEFYSFSVLGISIIIFLGLFLMLVAAFIGSIVSFVCRFVDRFRHRDGRATEYALLEWTSNSPFHLQRLANETMGLGTWSHTAHTIPITGASDILGILDISDPTHTRLRPQDSLGEELGILKINAMERASTERDEQSPTHDRESESLDIQHSSGDYYSPITDADDLRRRV